ncbi:glucan endo-1,3-beta-glucosidase 5-like [Prosopis cineraria]|uniref:glucan endo-1,3-beta-glucosidase 5-like n=1 Tax=Prosopis cineraria TaxID=364024 RepID=UPI00240FECD6|nr:glucan endo-1,3-beta-glucosidase 5-like [Prosopis cineraria]XP_054808027.1 glucan endo-1,3-beta-glucosidase 5-like [Prosopis cineraria]
MGSRNYTMSLLVFWVCIAGQGLLSKGMSGFGCNWGRNSSHPLPPEIVVQLLKDNGFKKVRLYEADFAALKALQNTSTEVMVGIPNDLLATLASNAYHAVAWVSKNVTTYITRYGVNIRYVAVGNEPFLKSYNGTFAKSTFPALRNIQSALKKAGFGRRVKVTIPLNVDVYQSHTGLPSGGDFRPDIHDQMMPILKLLNQNAAPLTINIHPFLSLNANNTNFTQEFAFFNGSAKPVLDGSLIYTNVLDLSFDTLVSALEKNGFGSMPIIIGEVGWPTDGGPNANIQSASRFYEGLFGRILKGQGSPKRSTPPDIYVFGLLDEDRKSTEPGNFERHWGIFKYDGSLKYDLDLGSGKSLVGAEEVKHLSDQWCVMSDLASTSEPDLAESVRIACTYADCTSISPGSSCGNLDARTNASYAFNMYFQTMNQNESLCNFNSLARTTNDNPSPFLHGCEFITMIDLGKDENASTSLATPMMKMNSMCYAEFALAHHRYFLLNGFIFIKVFNDGRSKDGCWSSFLCLNNDT